MSNYIQSLSPIEREFSKRIALGFDALREKDMSTAKEQLEYLLDNNRVISSINITSSIQMLSGTYVTRTILNLPESSKDLTPQEKDYYYRELEFLEQITTQFFDPKKDYGIAPLKSLYQ